MSSFRGHVWLSLSIAVLAFCAAAPACDPNHDWTFVSEVTRRALSARQAEALASMALQRCKPPALAQDKCALLEAVDMTPGRTGETSAALVTGLREALGRLGHPVVVGPGDVARELALSKLGPEAIYGPSFLQKLGRSGAALFVKVRLAGYSSVMRQLRDRNPSNAGLESTQVYERVRARVSIQQADGQYRLIDELSDGLAESYLYFEDAGGPTRLAELFLQRPSSMPLSWVAHLAGSSSGY